MTVEGNFHRPIISVSLEEGVAASVRQVPHGQVSQLVNTLLKEHFDRESGANRDALRRQQYEITEKAQSLLEQRDQLERKIASLDDAERLKNEIETHRDEKEEQEAEAAAARLREEAKTLAEQDGERIFKQFKDSPVVDGLLAKVRADPSLATNKKFIASSLSAISALPNAPRLGTYHLEQMFKHAVKEGATYEDGVHPQNHQRIRERQGCSLLQEAPPRRGVAAHRDLLP